MQPAANLPGDTHAAPRRRRPRRRLPKALRRAAPPGVTAHPAPGVPYADTHEDPDEVPHDVIGMLALTIVLLAMVTGLLWLVAGPIAAAIVGIAAGVWAILRLTRRAARERAEPPRRPDATA